MTNSQYQNISDSYPPAADRHLKGSTTLLQAGEYEEAAYLAGYVTECILKYILLKMDQDNPRKYNHDVTKISQKVLHFAHSNSQFFTSQYVLDKPVMKSADIITNWIPELRYKPGNTISESIAEKWLYEATEHHKILQEMWKDGYYEYSS